MPEIAVEELARRLEQSERRRSVLRRRLAVRHVEEDGFGWSIADLMTLLLVFFVLFYANAASRPTAEGAAGDGAPAGLSLKALFVWNTPDLPRNKPQDPFEVAAAPEAVPTTAPLPADPAKISRAAAPPPPAPDRKPVDAGLQAAREEILAAAEGLGAGQYSVRIDDGRLTLILGEAVTFSVGEADLLPDNEPDLVKIAETVAGMGNYLLEIAGHTDDVPISNARFASNWDLSTARSITVARFLIANGVSAERISVQGYADHRPLAPNDSPEHRQTNRRVEITLVRQNDPA